MVKAGSGTLTLTAANTYTGGTTVNGGELELGYQGGGQGTIRGTLTINAGTMVKTTVTSAFGYTSGNGLTTVNINGQLMIAGNGNETAGCAFNLTGGTISSNGSSSYIDAGSWGRHRLVHDLGGNPFVGDFLPDQPPRRFVQQLELHGCRGKRARRRGPPGKRTDYGQRRDYQGGQRFDGARRAEHLQRRDDDQRRHARHHGHELRRGGTAVRAGTLEVDGSLITLVMNVNAGTPSEPGSGQLAGSGTITTTSNLAYYNSTSASTFAGTIAGNQGLEVDGGALTLTGSSGYSGVTNMTGGLLVAGAQRRSRERRRVRWAILLGRHVGRRGRQPDCQVAHDGSHGDVESQRQNLLTVTNAAYLTGTLNLSDVTLGEILAYGSSAGGGFSYVNGLPGTDKLQYEGSGLYIVSNGPAGPSIWRSRRNWSASGSWTNNSVPNLAGTGAVFNQTSGGTIPLTLDSPQTVGTIVLGDSTGSATPTSYVLSGSTLTLNNNGSGATITVSNTGSNVIDATVILADAPV